MSNQNKSDRGPVSSSPRSVDQLGGINPTTAPKVANEQIVHNVQADATTLVDESIAVFHRFFQKLEAWTSSVISDRGPSGEVTSEIASSVRVLRNAITHLEVRGIVLQNAGVLRQALYGAMNLGSLNPVFGHIVARLAGDDSLVSKSRHVAIERYCMHPQVYDDLFGDFILPEFRSHARQFAAEVAYRSGRNPSALHDWPIFVSRLTDPSSVRRRRIKTGLTTLDERLGGGLQGLCFLGGDPGTGKTSLALAVSVQAMQCDPRLAVLFCSLEMSRQRMYERIACILARLEYGRFQNDSTSVSAVTELQAVGSEQKELLSRICVLEAHRFAEKRGTFSHVVAAARAGLMKQCSAQRVLLVVDSIQRIVPAGEPNGLQEADQFRIAEIRACQRLGFHWNEDTGDAVLAISEVRKRTNAAHSLDVCDLLGSVDLGYAAEAVLFLEPLPDGSATPDEIEVRLRIAKARDGSQTGDVPLIFEHRRCRFRESSVPKGGHVTQGQSGPLRAAAPVSKAPGRRPQHGR